MGEWLDDDRAGCPSGTQSYEQIRPLDAVETSLIGPFQSATALLIGERWIRWHFIEERHFDDQRRHAGYRTFDQAVGTARNERPTTSAR